MIKNNVIQIHSQMKEICKQINRNFEDVTLIAVSKTKPIEMLEEAYTEGIRDFGENKVQELVEKYEKLPKDIRWHMIGHLQRNKVKYIIDKVYLIHSVDSIRLAEEINKEAIKKNIIVKILIEVNVGEEDSKFGTMYEEAISLVEKIALLPNIQIKGFMTVAPYVRNQEENRKIFKKLKQLFVDINNKNLDNVIVDELSMGMSNDYEVAIEEGATYIRVGTGIFGERNYHFN